MEFDCPKHGRVKLAKDRVHGPRFSTPVFSTPSREMSAEEIKYMLDIDRVDLERRKVYFRDGSWKDLETGLHHPATVGA